MSFNTRIEFLDKYEAVPFQSTLRTNLSLSGTEIDLVSVDGLPVSGWITINGEEVVYYESLVTGEYPGLSGCERGDSPKAWLADTSVEQRYSADIIFELLGALNE